jgi:hypothetical protein
MKFIDINAFKKAFNEFRGQYPFDYSIIDNFFLPGIPEQLESEFLDYENDKWYYYKNAIEDKKALNDWNLFPPLTYKVLRVTSDQALAYDQNLTFEQNFVAAYNGFQQTTFDPSFNDAIAGQSGIINVNRTNFGNVDEVTVTWGLEFSEAQMSVRQYFYYFNA